MTLAPSSPLAMALLEHEPGPPIHAQGYGAGSAAGMAPTELAQLLRSFTEVTDRLSATHESLRGEVARLERELGEARGQLRRARELAALGEMAAGIAHEVRNPLGSIRLYASVLIEDLVDRPAEREVAVKIARAVSRLDAVVGDVLAFSRELRLDLHEVTVGHLVGDAVEACAQCLARHGVTVIGPSAAARSLAVRCDAGLMHQALVNVLQNAAEAIGEHGAAGPEARARTVRIDAESRRVLSARGQSERMVAIAVIDSGPGVPSEVLPRMFNPFFTTRHTGTGLGLAIVHRIVDAHGGRVSVKNVTSESGGSGRPGGAVVEFVLPAAERPASQERDEA